MKRALYILILVPLGVLSQNVTERSGVKVIPKGGEEIILYAADACDHCYYYLPSALRISAKKGTPEASFVVWKDETNSQAIGGILHLLVEWGLKAGMDKEVQQALRSTRDSLGVVMGAVMVDASSQTVIEGDDRLSHILSASLKNTPAIPRTPGAKMALSFHFAEREIADFLYYLKHPDKAKSNLRVTYTYAVRTVGGQMRTDETTLRLPFRQILITLK